MEKKPSVKKMKNEKTKLVDLPDGAKPTRGINKAPIAKQIKASIKNQQDETQLNTKKVNTMNTKTNEVELAEVKAALEKAEADRLAAEAALKEMQDKENTSKQEIKEEGTTMSTEKEKLTNKEIQEIKAKTLDNADKETVIREHRSTAFFASIITSLGVTACKAAIKGSYERRDALAATTGLFASGFITNIVTNELPKSYDTAGKSAAVGAGIGLGVTAALGFGTEYLFNAFNDGSETVSSDDDDDLGISYLKYEAEFFAD